MSAVAVLDKAIIQLLGGYRTEALARLKNCHLFTNGQMAKVKEVVDRINSTHLNITPLDLKNRILSALHQGSPLHNKPSYVCFSESPAFEFANSYPCRFKVLEKVYTSAADCIYAHTCGFLLRQVENVRHRREMKNLLDQCETVEEVLFFYTQCEGIPKKRHTYENLHAAYLLKKDELGMYLFSHQALNKEGTSFEKVVMYVLDAKFKQNPSLMKKLLNTGNDYLVCQGYNSSWSDGFDGEGLNFLGKCLMRLRGAYSSNGIVEPSISYYATLLKTRICSHAYVQQLNVDIIQVIFARCVANEDFLSLSCLSYTNKHFYKYITEFSEKLDLTKFCPKLKIIDAQKLEIQADDEPSIKKLAVIRCYKRLEPHIEGGEALTLLTMGKGLTLNHLIEMAEKMDMRVEVGWNRIVIELGNVAIPGTYRVLITDNIFYMSRFRFYDMQLERVGEIGCDIPTLQECFVLCLYTKRIFDRCLYGMYPKATYARTSTKVGEKYLYIGGFTGTYIAIGPSRYKFMSNGVGGRQKFG